AWERGEKPQTLAFIREGKVKRILASRWLLVPLVACAAAVLGCNRNGQQAPPPKPPEVLVSFPVTEQVTDYEYFTGQTVPVHSVDIKARVTGYLDKIDFKDGADVTKDTPLFRIDPRPYKAERDRAKASLAQAIARRDLAQAKLERTRTAFLTRAASKDELDAAVAEADAEKAAVGVADENLRIAELNLEWTTVKAPIAGRLTQRRVDPGNLVKADETLLTTLHQLDPMYAYFDVDERTVLKLSDLARKGKIKPLRDGTVDVELGLASEEGLFPHKGKIDFASAFLDVGTGTQAVRGKFPNKDHVLKPGLFVRIRLPSSKPHEATLIEERALGTDQGRKILYILKKKDNETIYKATSRPVTPGTLHKDKRVIPEGLSLDEMVVVSGLQRVRAGAEVVPVVRGKLQASAAAGELAGTVLADGGNTWQLDFSKLNAEEKENLAGTMKKLNGENVLVKGEPVVRRDSKSGRRLWVNVREMKAAK
ncbi:MAG TPA: efflux RND transporter periplasmic adaptor subunit, partial [Gemmataceae bacterium]|nr:efflux RND transporter periplasmic adaptor subunit [Gemmataceae bacterium]